MSHFNKAFLIITAIIVGCSANERTEIVERWPNEAKKKLVKYKGEGENETLVEEKLYTATGVLFEVIDHANNDTLDFHDLNKPETEDFPYKGVWQWEKTLVDSAGEKSIRKPNVPTPQGTYVPHIVEIDSSMVMKKELYYDNISIQYRNIFEYQDSTYSKFDKSVDEFPAYFKLSLNEEGSLILTKDYGYETETTEITLDKYFNEPTKFSFESDTLIMETDNERWGNFKQFYTEFVDSSYLKQN